MHCPDRRLRLQTSDFLYALFRARRSAHEINLPAAMNITPPLAMNITAPPVKLTAHAHELHRPQ